MGFHGDSWIFHGDFTGVWGHVLQFVRCQSEGEGQGEARFVGYEDLVGGGSRPQKKGCNKVNFVRTVAGGEGTLVILDSGADISALPMRYREVGFPLERVTSLRDAQGGKMTN